MHVAVVDIGNSKNLGWAIRGPLVEEEGNNLDKCVEALAMALRQGPLALGFEAPLFVPLKSDPLALTKARDGECADGINRPFSAGAGAAVLVTALVTVPYVLGRLRQTAPQVSVTLDWQIPFTDEARLLVFEAFVTNQKKSHAQRHVEDALTAIAAFQHGMQNPKLFKSAVTEPVCLSLIGSALLRTGWTTDLRILSQACLVIKGCLSRFPLR